MQSLRPELVRPSLWGFSRKFSSVIFTDTITWIYRILLNHNSSTHITGDVQDTRTKNKDKKRAHINVKTPKRLISVGYDRELKTMIKRRTFSDRQRVAMKLPPSISSNMGVKGFPEFLLNRVKIVYF